MIRKDSEQIKKLEALVSNDYDAVISNFEPDGESEIDLIGFDGDFVDIYEAKQNLTKTSVSNVFWQLYRDMEHLSGKYFIRDCKVHMNNELLLLKGVEFLNLKKMTDVASAFSNLSEYYENMLVDNITNYKCDLIGFDGHFVDLFAVDNNRKRPAKRLAFWRLYNSMEACSMKGEFVRKCYLYTPSGLFLLKGTEFLPVEKPIYK